MNLRLKEKNMISFKINNLVYQGEFKNGKRNGKGKEYDYFENIMFEGEYLNGKRWKRKRI